MLRVCLLLVAPNVLVSAAMVRQVASLRAVLPYLVAAPVALVGGLWLLASAAARRAPPARWGPLALVVYAAAVVLFVVVYPIADARRLVGAGTDADDALDLAARALLSGAYPYAERTYLNNPISPLPSWVTLAAPFVLLFGRAAYLSLFWLAVWLLLLRLEYRSAGLAALVSAAAFVFFPALTVTFVNGSDSFASIVAVCVLGVAIQRGWLDRAGWARLAGFGLATGIVLSSRWNVPLLLPLLCGALARRAGVPRGVAYGTLSALAWGAVTLPFWVANPAGFTPLHTYSMLGRFDAYLPGFGLLVPVATALLSLLLGAYLIRRGDLWLCMAVVTSAPVAAGFLAGLAFLPRLDFWPLIYGLMATPFWTLAAAPAVVDLFAGEARVAAPDPARRERWAPAH